MKLVAVRFEKCKKNPKRLFDTDISAEGTVSIKCPKCTEINKIDLKQYIKLHTEQIGTR